MGGATYNEENATQTAPPPTRGTQTTRQQHHNVPTFFTNRLGRRALRQTRLYLFEQRRGGLITDPDPNDVPIGLLGCPGVEMRCSGPG